MTTCSTNRSRDMDFLPQFTDTGTTWRPAEGIERDDRIARKGGTARPRVTSSSPASRPCCPIPRLSHGRTLPAHFVPLRGIARALPRWGGDCRRDGPGPRTSRRCRGVDGAGRPRRRGGPRRRRIGRAPGTVGGTSPCRLAGAARPRPARPTVRLLDPAVLDQAPDRSARHRAAHWAMHSMPLALPAAAPSALHLTALVLAAHTCAQARRSADLEILARLCGHSRHQTEELLDRLVARTLTAWHHHRETGEAVWHLP